MSNSKYPFITVIIPTHNRPSQLFRAIQSVLNQTYKDYELIVVDDHSREDIRAVVNLIKDTRVKYVLNERTKGAAGARNTGILKAKGEWIAFLDDDDCWMPRKLELQHEKILELDESFGLIYTGFIRYDKRNNKVSTFVPEKRGWIHKDLLYDNFIRTFSTVIIRTVLIKHLGGLDERFPALQDRELYMRVANISEITFIREPLAYVNASYLNRISLNIDDKLEGNILFFNKYSSFISGSFKLRYIWNSRVFVYASLKPDFFIALKTFPWAVSGLVHDPLTFIRTFGRVFTWFYSRKLRANRKDNVTFDKY